MKYISILILFMILANSNSFSQSSLASYLQAVQNNNKSLKSARDYTAARKMEAKTNLNPDNPEFEFGYFPGNTDAIGTKQVIGISQSLDFPSTYIYKSKIAGKSQDIAQLNLQKTEQQIMLSAKKTWCIRVYQNKLALSYKKRLDDAQQMLIFYQKKQNNGDATQLEVNKARLFLLNIQNQSRLNQSYQKQTYQQLKQLNGGIEYIIDDTTFLYSTLQSWPQIKSELDSLLPELKQFAIENQMADLQLKLNKSAWLPNLMLGYESEEILSQTYSGVKAGISIPLWQHKNSIKKAQADVVYAQSNAESIQLQVEGDFYRRFIEAEALESNLKEFHANLDDMNNEYLLARSLELGQISAIAYFMELDYFYNITDKLLELELMYQLSLADLYRYKL